MDPIRYQIIYDVEFVDQIKAIDRKFHALIRETIEEQLGSEPDQQTRYRKPLDRPTPFGARWELRFGLNNRFRVFYSVHSNTGEVHILAIGVKLRERLYIGKEEVKL
jgi:mRNA-degrading endonuclease RelE of RelBE toxin-antitoxin system